MQATNLTTTLSELNRLYGEYFNATEGAKPDVQKAVRAWIAYEQYQGDTIESAAWLQSHRCLSKS
jgi:uncharacterized protein YecT (DUF1311 family)